MLVVTTGNLEEVTLELVAEGVTGNLIERKNPSAHSFPVIRSVCQNFWKVDVCAAVDMKQFGEGVLTSVPMRFSMKGRSLRSSSTSMIFCDPLAG